MILHRAAILPRQGKAAPSLTPPPTVKEERKKGAKKQQQQKMVNGGFFSSFFPTFSLMIKELRKQENFFKG